MKFWIIPTFAVLLASLSHAAEPLIPVRVGGNSGTDAGSSTGEVVGIRSSLAVRSGPGVSYQQTDSLQNGQELLLCNISADRQWHGVVYSASATGIDCGVSSPITPPKPYHGPCKSGWVRARWVSVVAG